MSELIHMPAMAVQVDDRVLEADGSEWRVKGKRNETPATVQLFLVPIEGSVCSQEPRRQWKTFPKSAYLRVVPRSDES
jgi:hypothetical protein